MSGALEGLLLDANATLRDAMARIDSNQTGIALVVDDDRRLVATVTDGDIRRAMLAELDLDAPVARVLDAQLHRGRGPITAPVDATAEQLLELMERHAIRHVPLVDAAGRVVRLALLDDLVKDPASPLRAVVMAGGFGSRLGELTAETPKPMLPVGDQPLLERIIGQLRDAGIRRVNLTTHYRAETIADHFGDGGGFGVEIRYVNEETPLGTAGALGLLEQGDEPILVMNGDLVTRIDFAAMHRFHVEHEADLTVALRPYEVRVPYGVVEVSGELVQEVVEKPIVRAFVNAGIYLLEPAVCAIVPTGRPYDMPQLIEQLIADGRRVVGFPLREYWLDIGTLDDYERASADAERA
jgi:dTDP-glucose pyrophosphorylase/CBS domain-containing protein